MSRGAGFGSRSFAPREDGAGSRRTPFWGKREGQGISVPFQTSREDVSSEAQPCQHERSTGAYRLPARVGVEIRSGREARSRCCVEGVWSCKLPSTRAGSWPSQQSDTAPRAPETDRQRRSVAAATEGRARADVAALRGWGGRAPQGGGRGGSSRARGRGHDGRATGRPGRPFGPGRAGARSPGDVAAAGAGVR